MSLFDNIKGVVEVVRPGTEAEILQTGLGKLTGVEPRVFDAGSKYVVMYDDAGAAQVRRWMDSMVFGTAAGREGVSSVRAEPALSVKGTDVKLGNVISSYLIYRGLPIAVALVALGYWAGRNSGGS